MMSGTSVPPAPVSDDDLPRFIAALGLPGLVDIHVHFLPDRMMRKVWAYFDQAEVNYGRPWPISYRLSQPDRVDLLPRIGVRRYAPLVYPHKPGMARWLTQWVGEFADATPAAVRTATIYPEPDVEGYLGAAIEAGARAVKVHVQVGGFDPRDPLLRPAWGLLAEAGIPAIVHCGHSPLPGAHTGLDIFESVLAEHPRLTAVLAHAGAPDYLKALSLLDSYELVYLDTTMVGTAFFEATAPLPADWTTRLADVADRIVLGTDFPQLPHPYADQVAVITDWANADTRLGAGFLRAVLHDTPARLLGVD